MPTPSFPPPPPPPTPQSHLIPSHPIPPRSYHGQSNEPRHDDSGARPNHARRCKAESTNKEMCGWSPISTRNPHNFTRGRRVSPPPPPPTHASHTHWYTTGEQATSLQALYHRPVAAPGTGAWGHWRGASATMSCPPKKPTDRHAPLWGATLPNPTPCPAPRPNGGTGCRDGSKSYTLVTSSSLENSITHQRLPVKALPMDWKGNGKMGWALFGCSRLGFHPAFFKCIGLGMVRRTWGTGQGEQLCGVVLSWPSPVAESGTASGGPQGPRTRAPGPSSRPQQPA
jgi:hypothetical protein